MLTIVSDSIQGGFEAEVFLLAGYPSCHPTNSEKELKAISV